MATVEIAVPQMGEGLQEVRIVSLSKRPGDRVKRDELLYTMETDKALMEVESPHDGVLEDWLAAEDDVVAIGAPVARLRTGEEVADPDVPRPDGASFAPSAPSLSPPRNGTPMPQDAAAQRPHGQAERLPPRTRALCRELGLSDDEIQSIPAPSGKLMPADVEAYVAQKGSRSAPTADYAERALSPQQKAFAFRLRRSQQTVVPATMRCLVLWDGLRAFVDARRSQEARPSEFQAFAFCVARATVSHPLFRSTLTGDDTVREYPHVNLGLAVARDNGDLVTAVVPNADALDVDTFTRTAQASIQQAREGRDQADAATSLLLTYLGPYDILDGVPVLVSPAVGVLLLGAPHTQDGETVASVTLTFDHRLLNGVGAAQFLKSVAEEVGMLTP